MAFFRVIPLLIAGLGAASAQSVVLPPPDAQGWIKLFRGGNTADFYSFYTNGVNARPADRKTAFPDNTFRVQGDTIQVATNSTGHLMFRQPFSHYRLRFQMRWPGQLYNCGVLLHIQENDLTALGHFPRSLEAQGDPKQGMGQLWNIGDVWVTVRSSASGYPRYAPTASEIHYGGANANARRVDGVNGYGQPRPPAIWANNDWRSNTDWVTMEVAVYGSDSILHYVDGELQLKYRDPRVSTGGTVNNVSKRLDRGLLAWQAEGGPVWYRNLEIQILPGDSLYRPTTSQRQARHGIAPRE